VARGAASLAQRSFALTASPDQALPERLVRGGAKVLLLGEGNFSLAAAFCRRHAGTDVRVVASSLESSSEARSLWGAGPALDVLAELPGVDVLHGVDATALELSELRGEAFDAVAFTFPHSGKKGRIQLNKSLLSAFALSLQKAALLREPFGHAEVTLAAGQGGTPADGSKRRSFAGDSWQLALNVAAGGFLVTDAEHFNHDGWTSLGYRASGHYRGLGRGTMDKQFHSTAAVVHCLIPEGRPGAVSRWPEVFELDASFWVADAAWKGALVAHMGDATASPGVPHAFADAVCETSRRAVGPHLSGVSVVNLWQRPADGMVSMCLRFRYSAPELAMTHVRARAMHEAVKECLQGTMRVSVRTRADVVCT
jgi:hypothetical protein